MINEINQTFSTGPNKPAVPFKPIHLITLLDNKKNVYFLTSTIDIKDHYVNAKGFYCLLTEEQIKENYIDLTTKVDKKEIVDMFFPWHLIKNICVLTYRAK
jgi:hypothetical protein